MYADLDGQSNGSTIIRNAGSEIVVTALDISGSIQDLRSLHKMLVELPTWQPRRTMRTSLLQSLLLTHRCSHLRALPTCQPSQRTGGSAQNG